MIVAEESYETSEPTIDSHIVKLKSTNADVFVDITTPKFAAQAIKKAAEIEWKPLHFLNNVSASIGSVIKPAGVKNAQGIISSAYLKDPTDPQWKDDAGMKAWNKFLDKYFPEANRADVSVMYGYTVAQTMVQVLQQCGDDLTRANVMKQAASLKDLELGGLLPGIKINTSATDFAPLSQLQLMKLHGATLGAVRRHHQRRCQQLTQGLTILRPIDRPDPLTTKTAAPAALPQGLVLDGRRQMVFNCARAMRNSSSKKRMTSAPTSRIGRSEMPVATSRIAIASAALILLAASSSAALAQKKYDTGATDTEIKIGNIMPYSGPASAYGVIGKTEAAYFKKINDAGGINGRKINFISYDDGYSPPKTVEQARKLVESDEVLLIFNSLGTPPNSAIHKYMNAKKVPQLFVATGATKWNDPKDFPWTMGWQPSYQSETQIYAKYILKEKPDAKIAVLYQNDDYGKDYLKGLKDGLGAKAASMIVAQESYETTEPTIDYPHRQAEIQRRRRVRRHHDAEIRRAGDQEGRRDRVEAAAFPQQRLGLGRQRDQAGGL